MQMKIRAIAGLVLVSGLLIGCDPSAGDHPRSNAVEASPTAHHTRVQERHVRRRPQRPAPGIVFTALHERTRMAAFNLMSIRRDGSRLNQLSSYPDARHPRWSPDGRRIAYVHGTPDGDDLWVSNADGSGARLLAEGPIVTPGGFDWMPGSEGVVFSKHDDSFQDTDLYSIGAAGGDPKLILDELEPVHIDLSPNGRKIAFWSQTVPVGGWRSELFTISRNGSGLTKLTANPPRTQITAPVWSPDSRLIAFGSTFDPRLNSNRRYASQIFVADTAKGFVKMVSRHTTTLKSHPSWAPDGNSLAYLLRCDNDYCSGRQDIEIAELTSERRRTLTTPGVTEEGPLVWSADGHSLLFGAWAGNTSSDADLYSWEVSMSAPRNLTRRLGIDVAVDGSWDW